MSDKGKSPLGSSALSMANDTGASVNEVDRSSLTMSSSTSAGTTSASASMINVAGGTAMMTHQLSYQQELLLAQQMQVQQYQQAQLQRWRYWQSYGPPPFQFSPMMPLPPSFSPAPISPAPVPLSCVQEAASCLTQMGRTPVTVASLPETKKPNAQEHFIKEPHIEPPQDQEGRVDLVTNSNSHEDQQMTKDPGQGHSSERPVLCTRLIYGSKQQKQPPSLEIWKGDITYPVGPVDILVVSALQKNYLPQKDFLITCMDSVIQSANARYGIEMADITANHCEFDLRKSIGVWISKPLSENVPFRRILCVLIDANGDQPYLQSPVLCNNQYYHPLSIIYERIFSSIAYMKGKTKDLNHRNLSVSIPMVGETFNDKSVVADHMVRASKRALEGECPLVEKILLYGFKDDNADELQRAAIDSISSWSQLYTPPTPSIVTGAMQMKTGAFCLNDSEADVILGENDTHGITNAVTKFYKQDVRGIFNRKNPASVDQVQRLFDLVYEIKNNGRTLKQDLCFWVSYETAANCQARAREKRDEHPYHALPQVVVFGRKNNKKQVFFVQACPACIKHDIKENRVARERTNGNKKSSDSDPAPFAVQPARSSYGLTSEKESPDQNPQGDKCEGEHNRKRSAPDPDVDRPVAPIPEASPAHPTSPELKRQKGQASSELPGPVSSIFGWLTSLITGKGGEH